MTREDLIKYKEKLSKLNEKERNLYLRKLSLGEIIGPYTGYPSMDKPWLKYFTLDAISKDIPDMSIYDYFMATAPSDVCLMEYLDKQYYKSDIETEVKKYEKPYDDELEQVLFSKAKELNADEKKAVLSVSPFLGINPTPKPTLTSNNPINPYAAPVENL